MTTLTIKDLAVATELGGSDMSAIRGGTKSMPSYSYCPPSYGWPGYSAPAGKLSVDASQMIGQSQCVENNNGNNVAFANCINSTVNPTQTANNSIRF